MPSKSFGELHKNLTDVKRLILLHDKLSRPSGSGKRGKRALGHLTRGGIVLLCAAWERYVESVLEEGAARVARSRTTVAALPAPLSKIVTDFVNGGKSTFTQATLGQNLEAATVEAVQAKTRNLNSPKYEKLKPLFEKILDVKDIVAAWSQPYKTIDSFVSARGDVAHRGSQTSYVRISQLRALPRDCASIRSRNG